MDQANQCVKVYLPYECLTSGSGMLIGTFDETHHTVYVMAVTTHPALFQQTTSKNSFIASNPSFNIIGKWTNSTYCSSEESTKSDMKNLLRGVKSLLSINIACAGDPPSVTLHKDLGDVSQNAIVLIYDPVTLLSSYVLNGDNNDATNGRNEQTNLRRLVRTLVEFQSFQHKKLMDSDIVSFIPPMEPTFVQKSYAAFLWLIQTFIQVTIRTFDKVMHTMRLDSSLMKTVFTTPAIGSQVCKTYQEIRSTFCTDTTNNDCIRKLRYCNVLWRCFIDISMGLALMIFLQQNGYHTYLAEQIILWAEVIVTQLNQLLQWMMGVPAGLKLNSQLDQVLGRFFLYHIYLWTGYLKLLQPVLSDILWFISASGVFGISLQLSLLQDLISMMTLHIYCFYVYAAKLYNLQVYALSSLFRLFRGKKWNVLRKRVDSATFDVDQLFVGTLLFTILLFLLPTTALYYIVFMLLRLLMLSIQGCLHKCVVFINSYPVYSAALFTVGSHSVAGQVSMQVLPTSTDKDLSLTMQVSTVSWQCISDISRTRDATDITYTWGALCKKILVGELVYPWIDRS